MADKREVLEMEAILGLAALFLGIVVIVQFTSITRSLQSTEAMTKLLLEHSGIKWGVEVETSEVVKEMAKDPGKKIEAIKEYRQQSGPGLKKAKSVIERLRD